jgi:hypothetical protein
MLGQPVDLQIGVQLAELVGDCGVALRVAEPDRRRDVERPSPARLAAHPAVRRTRRSHEVAQQQVHLDWIARVREVAGPLEDRKLAVRKLREPRT